MVSRTAANKDEAPSNGQSPFHHHIVFLRALRDKADRFSYAHGPRHQSGLGADCRLPLWGTHMGGQGARRQRSRQTDRSRAQRITSERGPSALAIELSPEPSA